MWKSQLSAQFWPIWPKFRPKNFLRKLYLYYKLDIVPSYHPMQFKEKLISQNEENVKNLILGPILTHLAQI